MTRNPRFSTPSEIADAWTIWRKGDAWHVQRWSYSQQRGLERKRHEVFQTHTEARAQIPLKAERLPPIDDEPIETWI